jgi:hypothetical protein
MWTQRDSNPHLRKTSEVFTSCRSWAENTVQPPTLVACDLSISPHARSASLENDETYAGSLICILRISEAFHMLWPSLILGILAFTVSVRVPLFLLHIIQCLYPSQHERLTKRRTWRVSAATVNISSRCPCLLPATGVVPVLLLWTLTSCRNSDRYKHEVYEQKYVSMGSTTIVYHLGISYKKEVLSSPVGFST